jgi:hypothetical protein
MKQKHWEGTERNICAALGKRHLGGPGRPDCSGGGEVVEVKDQERRLSKTQMRDIVEKRWAEDKPLIVVSTSGFSDGAKRIARRHGEVHLFKGYDDGSTRKIRK